MPRYPVKQPPLGYGILERDDGRYVPAKVTRVEEGVAVQYELFPTGLSSPRWVSYTKRSDAIRFSERMAAQASEAQP